MVNKRRLLPAALVIAVLLLAAFLALRDRGDRVRFRGRTVRAWALDAYVGRTNATAALEAMGTNAVPGLVDLLNRRDSWARQRISATVLKLPRPLARRLQSWILRPEAAVYRRAGAKGLGLLGPRAAEAVPALIATLHEPDIQLRSDAATALARIGVPAFQQLTIALADVDPGVRNFAAYALGQMGAAAEAATPNLIGDFSDTNRDVRASAAYSAAIIGFPSMVAISNVLDHGDAQAREAAIRQLILSQRSVYSAVPGLLKMAQSEIPASRQQAIGALGALRIANDASVTALTNALYAAEPDIRLAAVKSLKMIPWRAHEALPHLILRLQDDSAAVRTWTAAILGDLGPRSAPALPELRRLAGSDPGAAAWATNAIRQIEPR